MLDGVAVSLAVGCGCHRRLGRGLWVSLSVWPWAMGRGCGARFFCLGCWVAMVVRCLATTVVQCLICGAGLAMLWLAVCVLFPRHSVSSYLLFSILGLIKVLITMLQVLVHAATSSMISGAAGVTAATGVPSTSLSSSSNAHSGFVDTMSDPFLPSAVEASCSDDANNFVTPVSISESSYLDITDPPSPSHQHFQVPLPSNPLLSSPTQLPHSDSEPSSSPPVASAPPLAACEI
nr:hypothetical protein CFP56_29761 [Quercus suber]